MFLKAPPKQEIFVYWNQYGAVNGVTHRAPCSPVADRRRHDPDAELKVIFGMNDPDTGRPVYETFDVQSAQIFSAHLPRIEITLADGTKLSQMVANCVCGAGAIGHAGPGIDRYSISMLAPGNHQRITT